VVRGDGLTGPVLFVALPAKLSIFGEAGLCSLAMLRVGDVPVVLLEFPIVPGGTLIMLPGGSVPVLLFPGSAFVVFLIGLNIFVFPGVPVLLPEGGSTVPRRGGPLVTVPV
jgi:hypothetical protein